jgi:acylphosphatase
VIARRVVVHGRVKGVGFRYAMVGAAQRAGVTGWVRNRLDGTVEVVVQGDAEAVERAIAWCRQGPPAARVTAVDVADEAVDATLADFGSRPTT